MPHMDRIGVRQLQQNAAAAVRRVRRGEHIEVTDRGRPVAVLAPVAGHNLIDDLEAAGRLIRAEIDVLDLGPPLPPRRRIEPSSRRLARMREHER